MATNEKSLSRSTRSNNITSLGKGTFVKNCKVCNDDHGNKSISKKQAKVNRRQTVLSDYFYKGKDEVDKSSCGEESKNDGRVMINFRKLVSQLLNAKVMVERMSQATIKSKLSSKPILQINLERLQLDQEESKSALRYCYKCKVTNVDHKEVTLPKKCNKCSTNLLYLCTKCNGKLYQLRRNCRRHYLLCKAEKKSTIQELKSITLFFCADCDFFTSYEKGLTYHLLKLKHKARSA